MQRDIQISNLRRHYPELVMLRQTANDTQYRIPFRLSISATPLYVKVTLTNGFPNVKPAIHMMSSVVHQSLDPTTT